MRLTPSLICLLVAVHLSGCASPRPEGQDQADEDSAAAAEPAHFDRASRPRLGADSFAIRFRGFPEGFEVLRFEETPTGYLYMDRYQLGEEFQRTSFVKLDRQLNVTQVTSSGREAGKPTSEDVRYGGGHATGRATIVRRGTVKEYTIDAQMPAGAFAGDALLALLPALPWQVGHRYALTMFDSDEQSVSTQILNVVGAERVAVPAGVFDTFRGQLSTTQLPVTVWVTTATPHRIVKMASANGETVLVR